jgi:hypothetical protein
MPFSRLSQAVLPVLAGACLLAVACNRAKPPEPVALEDISRVLNEAFRAGPAEARALAGQVAEAVAAQQWTRASLAVQALSETPGLSKPQAGQVASCLIAINAQVSAAAEAGDAQAEQLREFRRIDK